MSNTAKKSGVLLRAQLKDKILFADYFPHIPLGDRHVEVFLQEFKFQDHDYDRKVFELLLRDSDFQKLTPQKFFNHQLWARGEPLEGPVVKYKLQGLDDYCFLEALDNGHTLRLDANGLFQKEECQSFLKKLSHKIEYIEDPLRDTDWSDIPAPTAKDFIEGKPFDVLIYKPNCEALPRSGQKVIFSSYLGSNLGRWHSCAELLLHGDLKLYHGIKTDGFYKEDVNFFSGSYHGGFTPEKSLVNQIYHEISSQTWKDLCSM